MSDDKKDEKKDVTLPNVPRDAVGNYDPDKAAPGDYSVPPSFGPIHVQTAVPHHDPGEPETRDGKKGDKKDEKPADKADKASKTGSDQDEMHGDQGGTASPAEKQASLKSSAGLGTASTLGDKDSTSGFGAVDSKAADKTGKSSTPASSGPAKK